MEDERKRLIDWARSAPLDHVAQVLTYIGELDYTEAVSNPDQPAEPAVI